MPSKKKKYNARFPAGRIKKIMQTDEEVGKVAQAVPIIISRTLELFVESLLTKSMTITLTRSAKTLTPSHMKQCILSESRFDFLKDLVKNIPDASVQEDNENNALDDTDLSPDDKRPEQSTSTGRTPVIQFHSKLVNINKDEVEQASQQQQRVVAEQSSDINYTIIGNQEPKIHIDLSQMGSHMLPPLVPISGNANLSASIQQLIENPQPPALIPITSTNNGQNSSDNLYIDEDYDN